MGLLRNFSVYNGLTAVSNGFINWHSTQNLNNRAGYHFLILVST